MMTKASFPSQETLPALRAAVTVAWLLSGLTTRAGDWPNYRGPDHNGVSGETNWTANWTSEGPKVLWRASVGIGSSSVAIAGGRVCTMGNFGDSEPAEQDAVSCFDAVTGRVVWTHRYPCPRLPKYYEGGTLSTPTIEGAFVYALSKMGDLFCLDAASGKVIWEQQLHRKLGFALPTWHLSGSPLIAGERLILNLGSAGAAFDKRTGDLIWDNGKEVCGYSTPVPAFIGGVECAVIGGADSILALRISDGKLLWRYPFFNKHKATAADAIVAGDEIFASCAYGRGCVKIRITEGRPEQVFDNLVMRNLQSCSVLWRGHLYGFDEDRLKCVAFQDSRECWSEKGFGNGALSLCTDGRMLLMSEKSELVIGRAEPDAFAVIARAQILSRSMCRTVPVLANGRIYLRNAKGELACLDAR